MTLPLKDRTNAQVSAAYSAVTTCQTNGGKIARYVITFGVEKLLAERTPPIHLSSMIISCRSNLRKGFRRYTHKVATAVWHTDPDNLDTLTEDKKLTAWIASNETVQGIITGFKQAKETRDKFIYKVKAGLTKDMTEEELQAAIAEIRNCVSEPPDYVKNYCRKGR